MCTWVYDNNECREIIMVKYIEWKLIVHNRRW